jgi:hypothetical protein
MQNDNFDRATSRSISSFTFAARANALPRGYSGASKWLSFETICQKFFRSFSDVLWYVNFAERIAYIQV